MAQFIGKSIIYSNKHNWLTGKHHKPERTYSSYGSSTKDRTFFNEEKVIREEYWYTNVSTEYPFLKTCMCWVMDLDLHTSSSILRLCLPSINYSLRLRMKSKVWDHMSGAACMCPVGDKVTGRERNLQGSSSLRGCPGGPVCPFLLSVLLLLGFLLIFGNIIYINKASLEKSKPFWKCSWLLWLRTRP